MLTANYILNVYKQPPTKPKMQKVTQVRGDNIIKRRKAVMELMTNKGYRVNDIQKELGITYSQAANDYMIVRKGIK